MRIMTASRQSALEQSNAKLLQEVDRLTRENTELLKLRQDNIRLQERNVQLAAELSVRTRDLEPAKPEMNSGVSDLSDGREQAGGIPGDSRGIPGATCERLGKGPYPIHSKYLGKVWLRQVPPTLPLKTY